jgi:IS66 Orf2 like protein
MFTLPASVRIYVAAEPVDLWRSFDGLAAAARSVTGVDPLSGHVFLFLNRRRNSVKLLVWDRTGYLILYKRLARGTFRLCTEHARLSDMSRSMPANWDSCSRAWICAVLVVGGAGIPYRMRQRLTCNAWCTQRTQQDDGRSRHIDVNCRVTLSCPRFLYQLL